MYRPEAAADAHAMTEGVRRSGRVGHVWVLVVGLLFGIGWMVVGTAAPPLQQTCDPALSAGACSETIAAALKKGMPRPHPVLLAAHAEPGPQSRNDQLGHRATVTFDLLGMPGQTTVRLYLDIGGRWGGSASRSDAEMVLWSVAQGAAIAVVVAGVGSFLVRRRRAQA